MPARDDPASPSFHHLGAIQTNGGDRRPSRRCLAHNDVPILAPAEMVAPSLSARIEDPHDLPRLWIRGSDPIALMVVAHRARKPKVLPHRRSTQRLRDDVIY